MKRAPSSGHSPLSGRYLVRNPAWNAALRATDAVLSRVVPAGTAAKAATPSRILLAVGGHLGDAVIATSALPLLARAYPNASVGILLPSWSRPVVEGHPALQWIHTADHWKMNRANGGAAEKFQRYQGTASRAVEEIAAVGYDVAVDLYAYYPNSAWLLWRSGVPVRIGYESGGCGPLYTTALPWRANLGHTSAQHAHLIEQLTGAPATETQYDLPPIPASARRRATELCGAGHDGYVVVHPGTGDPKKAWPAESWQALIDRLLATGERVILTGAGAADRPLAASLATDKPSVLNLVDQLDWPTFRAVLANAKAAIGPDSVAMHVAAAEHTPAIAIMAAMSDPEHWRPLGERVEVLTRQVPCAPCFQKYGCASMTCVREVSANDVMLAYQRLLEVRVA